MRVLCVVLGLIYAANAVPQRSRIVGGETTTIETYPYTAAMLGEWKGIFSLSCGGTLITTLVVVSGGHCFPDDVAASWRVRLGSTYHSSGGTEHLVSKIIVHEQYNGSSYINDLAIVRLTVAAVLSDQIKTARIAGPRYTLPTNTALDTIGWGFTSEGGNVSEILRHVVLNIIDQQICTERHAYLKTLPDMSEWPDVTPDMICTGILDVGGKDSCQGDSGGPVIHGGDVLVGITSWGYECAHPFYPAVNVRVSHYSDWIYSNTVPQRSRIVGGETTTIETYPFMAAMLSAWEGTFYQSCGGTLITTLVVVSAGHCFKNATTSSSRVRLGSTYRSSGETEHLVSRITVHEQYNATALKNYVSIVRLSVAAVLSDQIKTARIAGPRYNLPTNTALDIIGWGFTSEGGNVSEILRNVVLNIIDQQICTERHAYLTTLPDMSDWPDVAPEMFCTGILDVGGKNSCQGDSGGPVIYGGDVLVGILSWGYDCAHPFYPVVNVRVSHYSDWIYSNSIN